MSLNVIEILSIVTVLTPCSRLFQWRVTARVAAFRVIDDATRLNCYFNNGRVWRKIERLTFSARKMGYGAVAA